MPQNVAQKLIAAHLVDGTMRAGRADRDPDRSDADAGRDGHARDAGARGDGPRARAGPSSARSTSITTCCRSTTGTPTITSSSRARAAASASGTAPPGNGVSHAVHMERFGKPGKIAARLRQPHAARRVRSACSRSAPAVSRSRSRWRRAVSIDACRRSWACRLDGRAARLG